MPTNHLHDLPEAVMARLRSARRERARRRRPRRPVQLFGVRRPEVGAARSAPQPLTRLDGYRAAAAYGTQVPASKSYSLQSRVAPR